MARLSRTEIPWHQQPVDLPTINWSNSLSTGLTGLINGGPGMKGDLVSGQPAWKYDGTDVPTSSGRSIGSTDGTAGVYWNRITNTATIGPPAWRPTSTTLTLMCVFHCAAGSFSKPILGTGLGTGSGFGIISTSFDLTEVVGIIYTSSTNFSAYGAPNTLLTDSLNVAILVCDGANATMWLNGKAGTAGSGSGNILYYASYNQIAMGGAVSPFGAIGLPAYYHFGALWNRNLTVNEIRSLTVNPWQLFSNSIIVPYYTPPLFPTLSNFIITNPTQSTARPRVTLTF